MRSDFAIFILTHGRADNLITMETLKKTDYKGRIVIVIDDTDKQVDLYKEKFGDMVYVFDKQKSFEMTDSGDNFKNLKTILYARNYCWTIAEELGIDYFIQLDDDYTAFNYCFDNDRNYITKRVSMKKTFSKVLNAMLNFLIDSDFDTVAFSQGGDFVGGAGSAVAKRYMRGELSRKAMNSFICRRDRPFKFLGNLNEDVNTYVAEQFNGNLKMATFARARLEQVLTQAGAGGMSETYKEGGTYVKSFYTIMRAPSCVSISEMGVANKRIHHKVNWKNAVPLIVSEDYKKQ